MHWCDKNYFSKIPHHNSLSLGMILFLVTVNAFPPGKSKKAGPNYTLPRDVSSNHILSHLTITIVM